MSRNFSILVVPIAKFNRCSNGKRTRELMRRKLFQGLRGGFSNSPNQWAEGRLLQAIRNELRGGFSNSIAQRAEGRLLQLVVNVGRHNTAILIELFWNSKAQSSYEVEWVDSVRRKPKIQWDEIAEHGFVHKYCEKLTIETTKN